MSFHRAGLHRAYQRNPNEHRESLFMLVLQTFKTTSWQIITKSLHNGARKELQHTTSTVNMSVKWQNESDKVWPKNIVNESVHIYVCMCLLVLLTEEEMSRRECVCDCKYGKNYLMCIVRIQMQT